MLGEMGRKFFQKNPDHILETNYKKTSTTKLYTLGFTEKTRIKL